MSLKQRRDHKPVPKGDGDYDWCVVCGDSIVTVYDRNLPVTSRRYLRHAKRWQKEPLP